MAREGTIVVEVLAAASTGAKSIDEINRPLSTNAFTTDRVAHESIVRSDFGVRDHQIVPGHHNLRRW